ncbi:hypothetical protein DYH55_02405 [Methylovirgula sp. 4M-Z18]|nr:hypothetical protein DYH55_02405 [Methylovirgula sp. 4M-Z18]
MLEENGIFHEWPRGFQGVIASTAKQSISRSGRWIASSLTLLAMTDVVSESVCFSVVAEIERAEHEARFKIDGCV